MVQKKKPSGTGIHPLQILKIMIRLIRITFWIGIVIAIAIPKSGSGLKTKIADRF